MKQCTICGVSKSRTEFFANKVCADGLQFHCKLCHRLVQKVYRERHPARNKQSDDKWRAKNPERALKLGAEKAKRWRLRHPEHSRMVSIMHAAKRRAVYAQVLPWAELDKIKIVYSKAKVFAMTVDHVVPLHHPLVCGLHVWHNLQLLESRLNHKKNNCVWPDMP